MSDQNVVVKKSFFPPDRSLYTPFNVFCGVILLVGPIGTVDLDEVEIEGAPDAAAIAFVRYNLDINSTVLADRLRTEKSVLIVPGDHFGMDHFLRISFGLPHDYLVPALDRIHDLIVELQ